MKNNIVKTLFALLAVVSLSGCIKETFPTSMATKEQVNANPAALESMVNGMSAAVNVVDVIGSGHYDFGYPAIGMIRDLMCDNMATVSSAYEHFLYWMVNKYQGENYIFSQFIWNFYTQFLLTANSVISAVDESSATITQRHYLAMAYCYRAMIYMDMGRMYEFKSNAYTAAANLEGLTVPWVDENTTEEQARNNPRIPKAELVEHIESDLQKAVELFGGTTDTTEDDFKRQSMSQPDLSVAYGLLARLYLWVSDTNRSDVASQALADAKANAQKALESGSYKPLSESQWTDTTNGFNNASSNDSWMWASCLVKEDNAVQTGIMNFTSWISSETSFGYATVGPYRMASVRFYDEIPSTDFRKKSWKAPEGSSLDVPLISATSDYDGGESIPEYGAVKFRPGSGNCDNYEVGAVVDYPLMRMEEMEFIIAEVDARNGDGSTLTNFMRSYRNPSYSYSGSDWVEECFFQKSVEFWGEGIIFFDYKRLNHGILRGYVGTNFFEDACLNTDALAPWMNLCIVRSENNSNPACISNPDPSDLVEKWSN